MLKCFSLIGENDSSYESVGNTSAYLNTKTSLKRNRVALTSFPMVKNIASSLVLIELECILY